MTAMDVCRLCMQQGNLTNIFNYRDGMRIDLKVMSCASIIIQKDDGLPNKVCETCELEVHRFHKFKTKCELSDVNLRELVKQEHLVRLKLVKQESVKHEPMGVASSLIMKSENTETTIKCKQEFDADNTCEKSLERWFREEPDIVINGNAEHIDVKKENECLFKNIEADSIEACRDTIWDVSAEDSLKIVNDTNKGTIEISGYQCEYCGRVLKLKGILKKHILTHTGKKMFACNLCPKTYARDENRIIHMRSHMGIRPYICEVCARAFTKIQDLSRHKKIHSDERNYSCPRCNRKFKRSSDIHIHMRTHTGVRPFVCRLCDKTYTSHSGLKKHLNSHKNKNGSNQDSSG